jgi:hypothetical protein
VIDHTQPLTRRGKAPDNPAYVLLALERVVIIIGAAHLLAQCAVPTVWAAKHPVVGRTCLKNLRVTRPSSDRLPSIAGKMFGNLQSCDIVAVFRMKENQGVTDILLHG